MRSSRVRFLEAELAKKDALIESLLDRLMARSFEQFKAHEPDAFLEANPYVPRRVLFDDTGLLEVDLDDDEGVTSGDRQG